MTVYELIQELSNYNADTEIRFHCNGEFNTDVEAEFDRDDEDDVQDVTVTAEIDNDVEFEDIDDYEPASKRYLSSKPYIVMNFEC